MNMQADKPVFQRSRRGTSAGRAIDRGTAGRAMPRRQAVPERSAGPVLTSEAFRLMAVLAAPGSDARRDPFDGEELIVRRRAADVSVAGGRYSLKAGDELLAADLVVAEGDGRMVIATAGLARLRREQGGDVDPFRAQHLETVRGRGQGEPPLRDAGESPLAWMARRRDRDGRAMIDPVEYEAGERLRRDIAQALMLPKMGMDWSQQRVDGGGARDPAGASDTAVAARQRVRAALKAVGTDLSDLLLDLCGFLKGLERIETERRWPARSAKVVARIALARLAEHYGLEREAVGPERTRLRLWRERA
ncbi:hypothetical protein QO016_000590 [Methylobacterium persicinum]|uniref:DUF6456 domain-containing protein n=2 Tax=Methylobacterium persicinum TaxID=374426 RepID=A0ABU0HFL2_9HYPH|nr:hypothetical protein [Methylobacterium persicinum]GJE40120.1 hypothetical protein KHHGKMAE_4210 [Methylobacterium persicinum]